MQAKILFALVFLSCCGMFFNAVAAETPPAVKMMIDEGTDPLEAFVKYDNMDRAEQEKLDGEARMLEIIRERQEKERNMSLADKMLRAKQKYLDQNYWECLLDEMPGVKTDAVAREIANKCKKEHPNTSVTKKKNNWIFGPKTASDCFLRNAKDVTSEIGARVIRKSCYELYPAN